MPLRETLQTILTDYPVAKGQPFAHHPLGAFIRHGAAEAVEEALGELGAGFVVEGSAGAGNWAAVPWISVFDPAITITASLDVPFLAEGVETKAQHALLLQEGCNEVQRYLMG